MNKINPFKKSLLLILSSLLSHSLFSADNSVASSFSILAGGWTKLISSYDNLHVEVEADNLDGSGLSETDLSARKQTPIKVSASFDVKGDSYKYVIHRDGADKRIIASEEISFDDNVYKHIDQNTLFVKRGLPQQEIGTAWLNPFLMPYQFLLGVSLFDNCQLLSIKSLRDINFLIYTLKSLPSLKVDQSLSSPNVIEVSFAYEDENQSATFSGEKVAKVVAIIDKAKAYLPLSYKFLDERGAALFEFTITKVAFLQSGVPYASEMKSVAYTRSGNIRGSYITRVIAVSQLTKNQELSLGNVTTENVKTLVDEDAHAAVKIRE